MPRVCYLLQKRTQALTKAPLQQSSVKNVFIRGSVVRYVHLPAASVDTPLLEDATRRGKKTLFAKHTKQLLTLSQKPLRHPQRPDKDRPIQYSSKATMIPHNVTNRA